MFDWSIIWDKRFELALLVLSIALAMNLVLFVFMGAHQYFIRGLPLYDNGSILPRGMDESVQVTPNPSLQSTPIPIGTIVAFFGDDTEIPDKWRLCDGQLKPKNSPITYDADQRQGGIQLPDLRGRFIRGAKSHLSSEALTIGGNDSIDIEGHSHKWAYIRNRDWHSFDRDNESFMLGHWRNGIGDAGEGHYPIYTARSSLDAYTGISGHHNLETLPRYAEVRFIIKVL